MGKSLFVTIEEEWEKFEVIHAGNAVELTLPSWFVELGGDKENNVPSKLEDADAIWQWVKDNEIELAFCHRAIGQMIIDFRAAARPKDKNGETVMIEQESAQGRIDELVFKPTSRPSEGTGRKTKKAIEKENMKNATEIAYGLLMAGQEDSMIEGILEGPYGKVMAKMAINNAHGKIDS